MKFLFLKLYKSRDLLQLLSAVNVARKKEKDL